MKFDIIYTNRTRAIRKLGTRGMLSTSEMLQRINLPGEKWGRKGEERREGPVRGEIRGWRGGSRINERAWREAGRDEGDEMRVKPARNVIFRQMCGHEREIIAPARSSWSSVRKCGRVVNVALAHARSLALVGMIVTEGQSQGRRDLAEDDGWWITSWLQGKRTCPFVGTRRVARERNPNYYYPGKSVCYYTYIKGVNGIPTLNNPNLETRDDIEYRSELQKSISMV